MFIESSVELFFVSDEEKPAVPDQPVVSVIIRCCSMFRTCPDAQSPAIMMSIVSMVLIKIFAQIKYFCPKWNDLLLLHSQMAG